MAYVRTVKTASGAVAVQIVWSWRRGSRDIEHVGSGHDEIEVKVAALKVAAAQRLGAGQTVLDLAVAGQVGDEPLAITSSAMAHLWDGLQAAYRTLGFESAVLGDNVFRDLARVPAAPPSDLYGVQDRAGESRTARDSPTCRRCGATLRPKRQPPPRPNRPSTGHDDHLIHVEVYRQGSGRAAPRSRPASLRPGKQNP